jgi:RHS repeat-associated protein
VQVVSWQWHPNSRLETRLTGATIGTPPASTLGYAYDLSGNRISLTANGSVTTASSSNRLSSLSGAQALAFAYDAAGNALQEGSLAYTYDNAGRRTGATAAGQAWAYAYNALGQRVRKSGPAGTTLYAYDEAGRLLGEYDGAGQLLQETVWLDDLPVATLRRPAGTTTGPASAYYVHTDHLGTPRRITRPADNTLMWLWEGEPFGNSLPNENPQGAGTFAYNLRFPGQVFDAETGLHYNYFRDYDPGTGRYVQSDPIGLEGGINTYLYAKAAPTMYTDPDGLQAFAPGIIDAYKPHNQVLNYLDPPSNNENRLCKADCNIKYQFLCTAVSAAGASGGTPAVGVAAGATCIAIKALICNSECNKKYPRCE